MNLKKASFVGIPTRRGARGRAQALRIEREGTNMTTTTTPLWWGMRDRSY
jgi:hypothetical protein